MADDDQPTGRKRRVSITKLQRHTAAGAELISLCQTITDDGQLADEEVMALRQWVDDNASLDLPARDYLLQTVRRIIEDGKVTDEERIELYQAIEAILPTDIRAAVCGKRRAIEDAAEAADREERDTKRQLDGDAKHRNRPIGSWNFMVAGCRYEGRPAAIRDYAIPGGRAYLVRDRRNRFSKNAVEVRLENGAQAGFVPEEIAIELAPLLDQGLPHTGVLTKVLTGGRAPIPVVQARIFGVDAIIADLVLEHEVPATTAVSLPSAEAPVRASVASPLPAAKIAPQSFVLSKKKTSPAAWVGLVICLVIGAAWCSTQNRNRTASVRDQTAEAAKRLAAQTSAGTVTPSTDRQLRPVAKPTVTLLPRVFAKTLLGKTAQDVERRLGPPGSTDGLRWVYIDEGKLLWVYFSDAGIVIEVKPENFPLDSIKK